MKTKHIFKIWFKTILIGAILPGVFGLKGGIIGLLYIYVLALLISGVCTLPLLVFMTLIIQKYKDKKAIIMYYFLGSIATYLILVGILYFNQGINILGIIVFALIFLYYILITILVSLKINLN